MRRIQIEALEAKTAKFRSSEIKIMPMGGWVNAIRTALGMTLQQLATRAGTGASRIKRIEGDEISGSVTIKTLKSIAAAMDSDLVYAIIPRKKIETIVIDRYLAKNLKKTKQVSRHMNLEGQGVDKELVSKNFRLEDINFKGLWND